MKFQLFTQVAITEDLPRYGLKKGSVGTIVSYYPMPVGEEDGYSIEGLLDKDTIEVAESEIEAVQVSPKALA